MLHKWNGLTRFYDDMMDRANDKYYNTYEPKPEECVSEAELEAYEEYLERGGEMEFTEWQKYIREDL